MRTERPPLVVVDHPDQIDEAREELRRSGWALQDGWPSTRAWRAGAQRIVCVGTVDSEREREEALAAVVVAGVGLLTVAPAEGAASFLEDLARIGSVDRRRRRDDSHPLLTAEQTQLLRALAKGQGVVAAASSIHVSRRTAYRELERARTALGVQTNREALAEVARWEAGRGDSPA